jgi:FixJ family two-component response regulator
MILDRLTDRQADVLRLMCSDMTDYQIAAALGISLLTARQHRYQIKQRLGGNATEICQVYEDDAKSRLVALRERIWARRWQRATAEFPGPEI